MDVTTFHPRCTVRQGVTPRCDGAGGLCVAGGLAGAGRHLPPPDARRIPDYPGMGNPITEINIPIVVSGLSAPSGR